MNISKVFVDAMVWIAAFDKDHPNHDYANRTLLKYLERSQDKSVILSDYVFNETLSYITRRQKEGNITKEKRHSFVNLMAKDAYNSRYVKILKVTEEDIGSALTCMKSYPDLTASLTDWTSLILMERNGIPFILSFDRDIEDITNSVKAFKHIKVWHY